MPSNKFKFFMLTFEAETIVDAYYKCRAWMDSALNDDDPSQSLTDVLRDTWGYNQELEKEWEANPMKFIMDWILIEESNPEAFNKNFHYLGPMQKALVPFYDWARGKGLLPTPEQFVFFFDNVTDCWGEHSKPTLVSSK